MFLVNEDNSVYITRGDAALFKVSAENGDTSYQFQTGDTLRISIFGKKNVEQVYLQRDFPVLAPCEEVEIYLTGEDTKIGPIINKPVDCWYEIELNPESNPQTIIGYSEDGPAIFRIFPESADKSND